MTFIDSIEAIDRLTNLSDDEKLIEANNKLRALARATPYMSLKKDASHEFLL